MAARTRTLALRNRGLNFEMLMWIFTRLTALVMYGLILFGNSQKLEIQPWQPETARTVSLPFAWKADTWYRMKLQVENLPDGKARARGKVWPAAEPEPGGWTIERVDPIPNRQGSPGIYADAPFEVFFDNLKVTSNR